MPSATLEEYLELIYKLSERGTVKPTPIAEALGVSGPTVTATLKRLGARGLITRDGTDVMLTEKGRVLAVDIIRRHRVAERLLVDVLGLSWEDAHEEACHLEHALSPRVIDALERFLENPSVCPHGHPIPTANGEIAVVDGVPLSDISGGARSTIVQVDEDDEDILAYLSSLGMYPGTEVKVCELAPFEGPLLIEVKGSKYAISRDIAKRVLVRQTGSS